MLADTGDGYDLGACLPDGSFAIDPGLYRYFSGSGFFEITLAFGSMTFTQVKAIDVAWDIVSHLRLLEGRSIMMETNEVTSWSDAEVNLFSHTFHGTFLQSM